MGHRLLVKRRDWNSTIADIESLTANQLRDAADALAKNQPIHDPVITRLLQKLTSLGNPVPESFSQKLKFRSMIKGLMVRWGMPAFWLTINPSDLRDPIVLILGGVRYGSEALPAATAAVRKVLAISNPVAVSQFFHLICSAVFDDLLWSHSGSMGVLGHVSNHFGVVESNGRGMLHLHTLVWATGNLGFSTLRDRVLEDEEFTARMINFLESIVIQSVQHVPDGSGIPDRPVPDPREQRSNEELDARVATESNAVAAIAQIHSSSHSSTCFKYGRKSACRFGMPRELVPQSRADEFGVIHLARDHPWVTPWNPAIAYCIRSNQDISWIPTRSKCLALLYYLTNYATKDDVSPHQMVLKAALLKESAEKAKMTATPNATDLRLRQADPSKFLLRWFNAFALDREVSGVQIASSLLQLPSYYTHDDDFVTVDLWWLRQYVRKAVLSHPHSSEPDSGMEEENCLLDPYHSAPVSRFDDYRWRGEGLASLSFYEYCMLVQRRPKNTSRPSDMDFHPNHPRSRNQVQRLVTDPSYMMTVRFTGQLTLFQSAEDAVRGGHPDTTAMENDVAEILLGFFVPWERLTSLFRTYDEPKRDAFSSVWNAVKPTLPRHLQHYADNFELLRKSKEDLKIDIALRASELAPTDALDDVDPVVFDPDTDEDEAFDPLSDTPSTEELLSAFHSVSISWLKESVESAQRIRSLTPPSTVVHGLELQNLTPIDVHRLSAHATAGLHFSPRARLQEWESRIK